MTRPVRLLHASDLHVGESNERDQRRRHAGRRGAGPRGRRACCSSATSSTTTACRPRPARQLADELARLGDVPVVVLPGNHDCLVPHSIWRRVELPANVTVLMDDEGEHVDLADLDIELWGRPHPDFDDLRPLDGMPPRGTRTWQVVARPRPRRARPRGPPPRLPDPSGADRRVGARLRRPRPLGRAARHELGGVTAAYSGSASRNGVCALVTLELVDGDANGDRRAHRPQPDQAADVELEAAKNAAARRAKRSGVEHDRLARLEAEDRGRRP